jgi:hypothetical protein
MVAKLTVLQSRHRRPLMRTPKEKELSMLSLIQAILLDQPHTADVRIPEQSEFYVAFKKMGGEPAMPGQWAP